MTMDILLNLINRFSLFSARQHKYTFVEAVGDRENIGFRKGQSDQSYEPNIPSVDLRNSQDFTSLWKC